MHEGKRWRMPVDDFAIARGATEPVTSKQTAERAWEPKFLGEIIAGRDPRVSPTNEAVRWSTLEVMTTKDVENWTEMWSKAENVFPVPKDTGGTACASPDGPR